ncbi:MAG: DNA methylase [Chloroflexi bacterium HGW-Chloroflexi-3]|nr:MAG: DNA methylase [Chloroflexi bacterium HGW-Chloroflexi-3]
MSGKNPNQEELFIKPYRAVQLGPIECLGMTFENDEKRRTYFIERLREKLNDPDFRKIEGFPIGEDEDILGLSDPPYHTACPNPWLDQIIGEWQIERQESNTHLHYHRDPFVADVSEGKYHPIYKLHPYPTKVPHRAIMRYILHYTEPGDIVFDGFCGTGMTGVAAQMCADENEVRELGYHVDPDGTILRQETDETGRKQWIPFSKMGARRAVLNDLSPAATFIAYNFNSPTDVQEFEREAKKVLTEVEKECGWMFETKHNDGRIGKINYTVWSDVFICPECSKELIFWEAAVDKEAGQVLDEFPCPHCNTKLNKSRMERSWVTFFDSALSETIRQAKQVPVLINYSVNNHRFEKKVDADDLTLIDKIENLPVPHWFPVKRIPLGVKTTEPIRIGISNVHHFYTKRNLWALASFLDKSKSFKLTILVTKVAMQITKLYRFTYQSGTWGAGGGPLSGTLYIPSLIKELNILKQISSSKDDFVKNETSASFQNYCAMTGSTTRLTISANESFDYIFLDPPFGSNLNYSELAFLWESWLKVWTNNKPEAIENSVQRKGINEYRILMTECFKEAFRLLKPGHWMTVEFSNTQAYVWNNIQTALLDAGFIVANVSALDKLKKSFNAETSPTAVKQDLVISAYKPNGGFSHRFKTEGESEIGVWDFVRTHLGYLPVIKLKDDALQNIPERDPRILYDQVVAYFVRNGFLVPLSTQEFQAGLRQRFPERDGMFFLPEQVTRYDRAKLNSGKLVQGSFFVSDEESAIRWLHQQLTQMPQTYQEIHPSFIQEAQRSWKKNEKPVELSALLQQNFLCYDGKEDVPSQIYTFLISSFEEYRAMQRDNPALKTKAKDRWYVPDPNQAGDLEKVRERALLREFDSYKAEKKKLKLFRLEAVRAGFKKAWQDRDYQTIVSIAEKIPEGVLEEDPKLLMWYDQAITRSSGN